ncbi:hypothetical protein QUW17_04515 [Bacteroides gallinaceum]|uniref:hypothetical protein n=1 Tax=Bacteroides gallinaceum TaxID=1462571 RepID=UPI0025A311E8|nr:hypothetical protein [Bacteroides gallinaceum]MDM8207143.1 hypothetical protein [Bacteroides gallinaceum]
MAPYTDKSPPTTDSLASLFAEPVPYPCPRRTAQGMDLRGKAGAGYTPETPFHIAVSSFHNVVCMFHNVVYTFHIVKYRTIQPMPALPARTKGFSAPAPSASESGLQEHLSASRRKAAARPTEKGGENIPKTIRKLRQDKIQTGS